jgi:hypothetical protein
MDITVYLPNRLGELARAEGMNLSRMLREAVVAELAKKGIVWDADFVTYEEATELIREALADGRWHSSNELHERFEQIRDSHFGRVKAALGVDDRRVGWGKGSYFEWRLPKEGETHG